MIATSMSMHVTDDLECFTISAAWAYEEFSWITVQYHGSYERRVLQVIRHYVLVRTRKISPRI